MAQDDSVLEDQDPRVSLETVLHIDDLDRNFLYKLGTLPDSEYQNLFWENQTSILDWWNHSNTDSLKRTADRLVRKVSDLSEPIEPNQGDENIILDCGKVILNAASELLAPVKAIHTLIKGLNEIEIKYATNTQMSQKQQLVQRITDIATKRRI